MSFRNEEFYRNQFQAHIQEISFEFKNDIKTTKISYNVKGKIISESFIQTLYKENDNVFVVGIFFSFICVLNFY